MLKLYGGQIFLQEFTEDNLHDSRYYNWLRDMDITAQLGRIEYLMPIQIAEIESYVRGLFISQRDCFFAIYLTETQEFIGTVKLGHIDWRTGIADVGILIGDKRYWGKGIAVNALNVVCRYAFCKLSLRKLTGGTAATNIAMCRCFERVGFRQEALLRRNLLMDGNYIDHCLFGMLKEEFFEEGGQNINSSIQDFPK